MLTSIGSIINNDFYYLLKSLLGIVMDREIKKGRDGDGGDNVMTELYFPTHPPVIHP